MEPRKGSPKPVELEALDGFPGKRGNITKDVYSRVSDLAGVGPPFEDMTDLAKEKWKVLQFEWNCFLKQTDREYLRAYCDTWADWRIAKDHLDAEGMVVMGKEGPVRSPWTFIADKKMAEITKMLIQFGATPLARTKVFKADEEAKKAAGKFTGLVQ